jgi:phosphoglycolate phosphatase-like HAD superfamily hydrolase
MNIKVIIFDFDGTIADTLDTLVTITNRLATEFSYKQTSPEDLAQIRNLSSREIVMQSGISIFKIPFLLKKIKENLHTEIQRLNLIPGIMEALIQLKQEGNQLGILTSNSEENVRLFLKNQDMEELFSFVYSESTLFSKHKLIRKFMKQNFLSPEEIVYVGDETRDIESAKKINIKAIAVSWGFNSWEVLAKHKPEFLIDKPSELIEVMKLLQEKPKKLHRF